MSRKRRHGTEQARRRSPRITAQLTPLDDDDLEAITSDDDGSMSLNLICAATASPPSKRKRKEQHECTANHHSDEPVQPHPLRLPGICLSGQTMPWKDTTSINEELSALQRYVTLTPREQHARQDVFAKVRDACSLLWPEADIELYGSSATGHSNPRWRCGELVFSGLETFCSDIDICIRHAAGKPRNNVRLLANTLKAAQWASRVESRTNTKVPIVYAVHRGTSIEADISFDNTKVNHGTQLQIAATAKFGVLRPVTLLLKLMLKYTKLDRPWSGGMSNFKLVCLLADLLQRQRTDDPAVALESFLQRYSVVASYRKELHCRVGKVSLTVETGPRSIRRLAECAAVFKEARDAVSRADGEQLVPQLIPIEALLRDRESSLKKIRNWNR